MTAPGTARRVDLPRRHGAGHAPADGESDESERIAIMRIRERQRLAIELHGSVAQMLFAIGTEATVALATTDVTERERSLQTIKAFTADAREQLQATLVRLNRLPAPMPLPALLESEVRRFVRATGSPATFGCSGDARALGELRDELLVDTLVEALRNVGKHAMGGEGQPPHAVTARLEHRDDGVVLSVRNEGPRSTAPRPPGTRGGGCLVLLAERAEQLRGTLDLRLRAEGGASVRLWLPLPRRR